MITVERLRQRLRYEPSTGWLIWLVRPAEDFPNERQARVWNTKYAGKRAGSIKSVPSQRRYLSLDGRDYLAARVIWQIVTGTVPPNDVDHWNGDSTDDRWANLRLATRSQNLVNMKRKGGKSGFKGVFQGKWGRCFAMFRGRNLGSYDTPEEAHAAYMAAAREAYGEFARAE